ncbi:MAG: hypothetical protein Solumvirus1_28 [Solumvirus sp.]|uniref:Late transcription factor 3-like protein n=1 Tax=Solumvirus sp. TaxID=2487773 RepID=A0A3G5AJM0_9VIRU|nr:MAG: hypothetical protein Solumvirus1_28 [Solumvirus sp.]
MTFVLRIKPEKQSVSPVSTGFSSVNSNKTLQPSKPFNVTSALISTTEVGFTKVDLSNVTKTNTNDTKWVSSNNTMLQLKSSLTETSNIAQFKTSSKPEELKEKYPTKLVGEYINDYNIIYADTIITYNLTNEKNLVLPKLTKELNDEELKSKGAQTVRERKNTLLSIDKIKKEIERVSSETHLKEYKKEVSPILEEYSKIGPFYKKKVFGSLEVPVDQYATKRLDLVEKFVTIAKKYIEVELVFRVKQEHLCKCGYILTNVFINDDGAQICPECGYCSYFPQFNASSLDADTLSGNKNKDEYDNWDNLYKAFLRFQGKQVNKISEKILESLDKYFRNKKLLVRDDVGSTQLDNKGRRKGTTLQMMITALKETQNVSYYEDANLICKLYWQWELPDLSHLESKIRSDYTKTQEVFNSIPKERTSNPSTQYRLYKHLQLAGVDCNQQDFKMPTMRNVIEAHDEMWKIMCAGAKDSNIYFIPTI